MDFQGWLEYLNCKACIMSVETFPSGKYGNIRVLTGNMKHIDEMKKVSSSEFVPDVPYEKCFPKDLNFEDFCYRSAVLHEQLHTYVNLYRMGLWLEIYMLPLESDKENTGYCLYAYDISERIKESSMADVSPESSLEVLSACIKMHGASDFKGCMKEAIRGIRSICDARRCCILLMDTEAKDCSVLSDDIRPGENVPKKGESMRKNFYKTAASWEDTLAGSTCLIIKNEWDMQIVKERNPLWYESLSRATVKSLVLFPLKHNGKLVGYIWASNFDVSKTTKIKEVLELTSFFIASEIANYLLLNKLEILSTMDMLTGTKNRNAMNNYVAEYDDPEITKPNSLGVVFADLNGLKLVNDRDGHVAGDRLLKKSAAILKRVFWDEDIFRAGGDEFLVLAVNGTQKELEDKVALLKNICEEDKEVSFAVGMCFDDREVDIRKAMHTADERMYEDKDEYYRKHPERKHR